MRAKGYIALTYQFYKDGRRWVGVCKELGTSTFSRSLPEVEKQLEEAVCLHLNTLEDVGERERFFQENNIKLYSVKPKNPTFKIQITGPEPMYLRPHIQQLPVLNLC
jgi:predicted RNase H-like HicB family nuclease